MQKPIKLLLKNLIYLAIVFFTVAFLIPINKVSASEYLLKIEAGGKEYLFTKDEIAFYNGKHYLKDAINVVDKIYLDTIIREKDATCTFNFALKEPFTFEKERMGLAIDKEKLLNDISDALNSNKKVVKVTYSIIKPKISLENVKKETFLRGRFTTYYSCSEDGRKHNISLSTSKISNLALKDGEEFSFNKIVGERSEANGFKISKVIVGSEYAEGVGGGVCQTSTTLYNCALISGLKITEQHPHSLNVGYIEPSFDAMVNYFTTDLKFVNNTGGTIYIGGIADGERVTFAIYGKKLDSTFEREYKITSEIECNDYIYEDDYLLKLGQKTYVRKPKNGFTSEGYLIEYLNGVQVNCVKLRSDKYNSLKGIIKVGKG